MSNEYKDFFQVLAGDIDDVDVTDEEISQGFDEWEQSQNIQIEDLGVEL